MVKEQKRVVAVCKQCGSANVTQDCIARFNVEKQEWVYSSDLDNSDCDDCGAENCVKEITIKFATYAFKGIDGTWRWLKPDGTVSDDEYETKREAEDAA